MSTTTGKKLPLLLAFGIGARFAAAGRPSSILRASLELLPSRKWGGGPERNGR